MAEAQEARLRARRRTFDGRFNGREMALQFMDRLLDIGIPPERIQITEASVCCGNTSSDAVWVTVWFFSHGEIR